MKYVPLVIGSADASIVGEWWYADVTDGVYCRRRRVVVLW